MACSFYWPHPIYLDIYIVYIFLIAGCNAADDSGELAGIISGSVFAFILFIGLVIIIVYCIIKAHKKKKAKKQKLKKKFDNLDHRTMVVRRMPPVPVGHAGVLGYPNVMFDYQPIVDGDGRPKMPIANMATISHIPGPRPQLVPMSYSTSGPSRSRQMREAEFTEYRQSNHQGKSRSKSVVGSGEISAFKSLGEGTELTGRNSQFILRKKEDSSSDSDRGVRYPSKLTEPYTLTSLFNRDISPHNPVSRDAVAAKGETATEIRSSGNDLPFHSLEQKNGNDQQRESFNYIPKRSSKPELRYSDNLNPERPITPDYDINSILDGAMEKKDSPTDKNKFSYADVDDLTQNIKFRSSGYTGENLNADLFGTSSKQVQFNPLSSDGGDSSIRTSLVNPGSYHSIPPAPPLPKS